MKLFVVILVAQHEHSQSVLQIKARAENKEHAIREAKLHAVFDKPVFHFTTALALEITQNDIAWAEQNK